MTRAREITTPPAVDELVDIVHAAHSGSTSPFTLAIDGVDGVGKTTFARLTANALSDAGFTTFQASIDDFHFTRDVRYRRGRTDPRGYFEDSFDHAAFARLVLEPLEPGGDRRVRLRHHDLVTDEILDAPLVEIPDDAIVVVDGVFLQSPLLRTRWGLVAFLDAPFDATVPRAIERDCTEHRNERSQATELAHVRYVPGQQMYLDELAPREHADVVIDYTDPATATVTAFDRASRPRGRA